MSRSHDDDTDGTGRRPFRLYNASAMRSEALDANKGRNIPVISMMAQEGIGSWGAALPGVCDQPAG